MEEDICFVLFGDNDGEVRFARTRTLVQLDFEKNSSPSPSTCRLSFFSITRRVLRHSRDEISVLAGTKGTLGPFTCTGTGIPRWNLTPPRAYSIFPRARARARDLSKSSQLLFWCFKARISRRLAVYLLQFHCSLLCSRRFVFTWRLRRIRLKCTYVAFPRNYLLNCSRCRRKCFERRFEEFQGVF